MRPLGLIGLTAVTAAALTGCSTADVLSKPADTRPSQAAGRAASTSPSAPKGEPFSLYTHCGFSSAEYAGRFWVANTPTPELTPRGDGTGITTNDGYTVGTMTVVEENRLRFTIDDPFVEEAGLSVDFVPGSRPTSWCE